MLEFVQITSQYSNAVLVAILPYVTDFSQKLDLPVQLPVTTNMVRTFRCDNRKDKVGGLLVLTNGCQFTFLDGRVCVYRSPESFYSLQDTKLVNKLYGNVNLTEPDALKVARETITRLGYTDRTFYADRPPKVIPPVKIKGKCIPRYRFKWLDPSRNFSDGRPGSIMPIVLDMEVDASDGRIQMLSFAGTNTFRPGPKVDVSPPPASSFFAAAPPDGNPGWNNHTPSLGGRRPNQPVSASYADAFLQAILPQISDLASQAGLSIQIPITTNDVDMSRSTCSLVEGHPYAQLYLKNGDRFNFDHGHVCAYYGHDAFRRFPFEGDPADFLGNLNMTTNEAIALGEQLLRKMGYSGPLAIPHIETRRGSDEKEFTRRIFHWRRSDADDNAFANVEVDMATKTIKSAYCDDSSLWRDPPKINAPITEK